MVVRPRPGCRFVAVASLGLASICGGAGAAPAVVVASGDDWSLPVWVQPSENSGFFSESADPSHHVEVRVVDLTWRQLKPTENTFSTTATDSVYGMSFGSWDQQLAGSDPFWLRIWVSGADWAPQWAQTACNVTAVGNGYENDPHLPIWNACLWSKARAMFREVFEARGLRSNPRLRFAYVPGAFTWCEFDFDIPGIAVAAGTLDFPTFNGWFQGAMQDLVDILDGENADPADDFAWKLVYTGEDYPYLDAWGTQDDLLARDTVARGMGIRTGITEVFDDHLNHVPAYGTRIGADGYMTTDENWVAHDGHRILGTENECYNDCGFHTSDPYYAVKMSNLKALQLRMNWIYVVPPASYMEAYATFWGWVRLELEKKAWSSPDAWVALREAEDVYWEGDSSYTWTGAPYVKNYERWLEQRDLAPGGMTKRGTDVRVGEVSPDNGTAYEGRRTDRAQGNDSIYLQADDRFLHPGASLPIELKITFLDSGSGAFHVEYPTASGVALTPSVAFTNTNTVETATFRLDDSIWNDSLLGGSDLRLVAEGPSDLEARFVRLVKLDDPKALFLDGFESGTTLFWSSARP